MNSNQLYDNRFSNGVLQIIGTLIRTVERSIVTFFDGMRSATEHGTPSLLGFIAALLPIITPLPVAFMTAHSLETFLRWDTWQAYAMAGALEMLGFVVWVSLTEELIVNSWQGTTMQLTFGAAALVYQILLVAINAILASLHGEAGTYVLILALLSVLPALSSIAYGYRNHTNTEQLERERQEEKDLKEKIRQEKRQDRKEAREMKLRYASDAHRTELEQPTGGKFRK